MSSYSPVGYIVTKIRAHDVDVGSNAQLVYSMTSHGGGGAGGDDVTRPPFDVDASNGAVYVTRSLGGRSATRRRRDYVLAVTVRDRGGPPPLSASASLVVHVNDSRSFAVAQSLLRSASAGAGGGRRFGFNQQVLVVLAAVTSIVAMLLVAAIVFVRRRHLVGRHAAKPPPTAPTPPPPAVAWVSPAVDESKANNVCTAEMLDVSSQHQLQQQYGIKRPTRTAATLPLLRVNDLLRRETYTSHTGVSCKHLLFTYLYLPLYSGGPLAACTV